MYVGTDCSSLVERTDLNNVVGTIMINQQRCSYMTECYLSGNDKITRLNSETMITIANNLVLSMNIAFSCSNNRCCLVNAEQRCRKHELHRSFNNIVQP